MSFTLRFDLGGAPLGLQVGTDWQNDEDVVTSTDLGFLAHSDRPDSWALEEEMGFSDELGFVDVSDDLPPLWYLAAHFGRCVEYDPAALDRGLSPAWRKRLVAVGLRVLVEETQGQYQRARYTQEYWQRQPPEAARAQRELAAGRLENARAAWQSAARAWLDAELDAVRAAAWEGAPPWRDAVLERAAAGGYAGQPDRLAAWLWTPPGRAALGDLLDPAVWELQAADLFPAITEHLDGQQLDA